MTQTSSGIYQAEGYVRARRAKRWTIVLASLAVVGLIATGVLKYLKIGPFSDKGAPVSFGQEQAAGGGSGGGQAGGANGAQKPDSKILMPTGPAADFKNSETLGDGTHIAVTTLEGKKSGFTGKVWVWAPKEYKDPKFKDHGFPVLIALPGGPGFPNNYWMGTNLKLQSSITKWHAEGKSKPFLLAMPVLNPKNNGTYWDGSDIPGQPKMGTWLTEDVPDLMKANFRTIKSRDGWAFMGSSSGGFAGMKAVLKHPDKFKAAIASGPDFFPDSPLWKGHDKERDENDPKLLAKDLIARKGPDVYIAFQYGTREDPITINGVKNFVAQYGNGPVHTSVKEIPGGKHDAATYVPSMGQGPIQFISEQLSDPIPAF
ncbi:alpha/beta hydrolase [Streptomyces aureoversilis]|uniref:Alpha/beta hydrolase n=1 Tax=Streptomyces aureoversilis TaxID=67277 RepID=A0ABW0A782_9ACTN